MRTIATDELKVKLLEAKGHKYIHKGHVKFHEFYLSIVEDKLRITGRHKDGTKLFYLEPAIPNFSMGDTLTFCIEEGFMRIRIT